MLKIISGGQTGVDRGALDAALELGTECGGWCPAGGLADADGTLIICGGKLSGGTRETLECCRKMGKPHLVIDCDELAVDAAIGRTISFVAAVSGSPWDPSASLGMTVLNVAGPRASQWPDGHEIARQLILAVLRRFSGHESGVEYSEPDSPRGEF